MSLPPAARLFTLSMAHVVPRALHVVTELGIADHLQDEALDCVALAAASDTGAQPDKLRRLMALLAAHGVFETADGSHFRHNDISRLLRADHPHSMRDFVLVQGRKSRWKAIGELKHTVLTGETGARKALGMEIFEWNAHDPEEGAIFDRAMRAKARGDVAATLEAYDFSGAGQIVDIGGGAGHLIDAISRKTGRRGILFDLPHVGDRLRGTELPFDVATGDFFADPLPAGDTYLLMHVLHDWNDDDARRILAAVRGAARPGCRLLVIEMLIPQESVPHPARELDLLMMSVTGGRERTQAEFAELTAACGWRFERPVPLSRPIVILEAIAV
ncbi:MAG: methyltransferase [Rhizobiaceae bacterium]